MRIDAWRVHLGIVKDAIQSWRERSTPGFQFRPSEGLKDLSSTKAIWDIHVYREAAPDRYKRLVVPKRQMNINFGAVTPFISRTYTVSTLNSGCDLCNPQIFVMKVLSPLGQLAIPFIYEATVIA